MIKLLTTKRQGDSGGPLTYKSGTQHILIGESSWVFWGCGGLIDEKFGIGEFGPFDRTYNVYGRVSVYRKWIEEKMNLPSFCGSGPDADE